MHFYADQQLVAPWTPGALPSVTTILDVAKPSALYSWRERVGVEEADRRVEIAQDHGNAVHSAVEQYVLYPAQAQSHSDRVSACLDGFMRFLHDNALSVDDIIGSEVFVLSEKYGYAGRLDLLVNINNVLWIVDIKTGAYRDSHELQLAAYKYAYLELTGVRCKTAVLQLTDEIKRGYRFKETRGTIGVFLAHKKIFDWQNKKHPIKEPKQEYEYVG